MLFFNFFKDLLKKYNEEDIDFKELIRGSTFAFVLRVGGLFFSYLFTFLVTRDFGADVWGLFTLSITILQLTAIIGRLGMDTAMLRLVAEYSAIFKLNLVKKFYIRALIIVILVSLLLSIILFFLSQYISLKIFHKSYFLNYLKLISVSIIFFVCLFINRECIRGLKYIKQYMFLGYVGVPLLSSLLFIILKRFIWGNYFPTIVYILSIVIISLLSFILWIRFYLLKSKELISKSRVNEISNEIPKKLFLFLIKLSLPMLLSSSLFFVMQWTDTIMLGILRAEKEVGIYNVALKVSTLTSITLFAINSIAAPKFAELWGRGDFRKLEKVVRQSTRLIFWSSLPILIVFMLFPSFILSFFGEEFRTGSIALIILTFGQFINAISGSVGYLLQMTGQQKVFKNIILIAVILNITLNFLLIPKFGINGAAIASMFSMGFWNIASAIYIKKKYNIKIFYIPFIKS